MDEEEARAPDAENLAQSDSEQARAQAEFERLRAEASGERNRAEIAIAEAARLGAELAAASDAAAAFEADIASMRSMLDEADKRAAAGAVRYRELAVRSEPALPPDMITGDTIEAIDASLGSARELAGRVRSHIEEQTHAARVPAGAPNRRPPDISAMTPEQKIRYGLAQRQA